MQQQPLVDGQRLAAELVAAKYVLVDTTVIGARTHKIWKSEAAWNSAALDWYLNVAYAETGSTEPVGLMVMEAWDSVNKRAIRGPVAGTNQPIHPATGSKYGDTSYSPEGSQWTPRIGGGANSQIEITAGAFTYYLSVTPDRVVAHASVTGATCYHGLYQPAATQSLVAGPWAPFPLASVGIPPNSSSTSMPTAYITRTAPLATGASTGAYFDTTNEDKHLYVVPGTALPKSPLAPRLQTITFRISQTSEYQFALGTLIGFYAGQLAASVTRGDRVTVGADEYVILRGAGVAGWFVKAS